MAASAHASQALLASLRQARHQAQAPCPHVALAALSRPGTVHKNDRSWQAWRRSGQRPRVATAAAAAPQAEPSAAAPPAAAAAAATHFTSLLIQDFALVRQERLQLDPGLTVITGESGAGKSVLVEAFGQILGAAAFEEAVRPPAATAVLEASVAVASADQPLLRRLLGTLGVPQRAAHDLATLTIRRELTKGPDGIRSRCSINGSPTSVRALREVGALLVDVNGQHAALTLKDGATRLRLLDRLAGTAFAADAFAATLAEWQAAAAQLRELDALSDEQQREAMQQLVDEVHAAGVEEGEDRALRSTLRQLDGRRAAAERCRLVAVGLNGDGGGGIAEALREVQLQVKQLLSQEERLAAQAAAEREEAAEARGGGGGARDPSVSEDGAAAGEEGGEEEEEGEGSPARMLQSAVALLDEAQLLLDDAEEQVSSYAQRYRFDQREYDQLSSRLQQLERLMKQHDASSADELLELARRQEAALDSYFQLNGQRDRLEAEAAALLARVQQGGVELSAARRAAAQALCGAVEAVLGDLAMAGARFDVRIAWTPLSAVASGSGAAAGSLQLEAGAAAACGEDPGRYRVRPGGLDSVEFLFAAGPAEPLRPLSAVASGGETARLMLALKAAPAFMPAAGAPGAAAAAAPSGSSLDGGGGGGGGGILLLDEIDSGVGARLGQPIGRILRRMAAPHASLRVGQILCVSHLPQVAAAAEHHLCVRKAAGSDDRVVTRFEQLRSRPERLGEISAMLGLPEAAAEELLLAAAADAAEQG